ncbi:membrane anchor subunit of succinate dehydrogenase, Sdh4 [Physocladia obscura]|uniref:Succinate dehydrogenase [ubiquinone] cytochrome b small subunit n=1 Tax=Physocladia obscura TaxID=109957 RepID=A0AAD5X7C8_9FUNG|nr:membrane anchor subunit of succinate dehydrogenase, Sdh4 [Physocladia obscura]
MIRRTVTKTKRLSDLFPFRLQKIGTQALQAQAQQMREIQHQSLQRATPNHELSNSDNSDSAARSRREKLLARWHGSEHWTTERFYSILLVPLVGTALAAGPVSAIDFALGIFVPLHTHMGFDTMIQDYVPTRKYRQANLALRWSLRVLTGLVLYSVFCFNTMDVGLTAFVQRLWTGESRRVLKLEIEAAAAAKAQ